MRRISFVLIGEGAPLVAVAKYLATSAGAEIAGIISATVDANHLGSSHCEIRTYADFLTQFEPKADWLVSINSAIVLPAQAIDKFNGRALNMHNGPLPEYAGRHVTQWGIRNGEMQFGSTVHFMVSGVDAGDIVAECRYPIRPHDTGLSLFRTSFREGRSLLIGVLSRLLAGEELATRRQDLARRRVYTHRQALDPRVPWTDSSQRVVDFLRAGDYRPLSSPTYTATLTISSGPTVQLFRARTMPEVEGEPGEIISIEEEGPVVACGSGAVVITDAVVNSHLLDRAEWNSIVRQMDMERFPGR